ncbi:hypothetical protein R50073_20740 [Maricurvus nonylphenolicus]
MHAERIKAVHLVEEADWPPFTNQKLGKAESGLSFDLMQAIFSRLDIAVDISLYPQKRMLLNVYEGNFDGVTMLSKNTEREKYLAFSDPVMAKLGQVYYRADRAHKLEWQTYEDLRGLTIGITRGHNYGAAFEDARQRGGFNVVEVTRVEQSFYLLAAGRVDAVFCIEMTANHILQSNRFNRQIVPAETPYYEGSYHIALSRKSAAGELMADINATIAAMQASGDIDAILAKYR